VTRSLLTARSIKLTRRDATRRGAALRKNALVSSAPLRSVPSALSSRCAQLKKGGHHRRYNQHDSRTIHSSLIELYAISALLSIPRQFCMTLGDRENHCETPTQAVNVLVFSGNYHIFCYLRHADHHPTVSAPKSIASLGIWDIALSDNGKKK